VIAVTLKLMGFLVPGGAAPRKKNLLAGASDWQVGGAFRSNAASGLRRTTKDKTHDHRPPHRPDRPHPALAAAGRDDFVRSLTLLGNLTRSPTPMTFETLIALIVFIQLTLPLAVLGASEA
jgi:hypothetical protein